MRVFICLCVGLLLFCANAAAQTVQCDRSTNHGGLNGLIYNNACPPERPYCTGGGLCSECAVGKDSLCDCPPNYKCAESRFNTVRSADFCAPIPLDIIDTPCLDNNDCRVQMTDQRTSRVETAFGVSCTNSECRYCNGRTTSKAIICIQGVVPNGADARPYGSKTDTARGCFQSADVWNFKTRVLDPPLPTDSFEYERQQYVSAAPQASPSPSIPAGGANASPAPSAFTGAEATSNGNALAVGVVSSFTIAGWFAINLVCTL